MHCRSEYHEISGMQAWLCEITARTFASIAEEINHVLISERLVLIGHSANSGVHGTIAGDRGKVGIMLLCFIQTIMLTV